MHLGILQTDHVLDEFQPDFGDYPEMFEKVIHRVRDDIEITCYDCLEAAPTSIDCDAYIITGSRHSVYDDLPWITDLVAYIRCVLDAGRKVLGVCFGHQLMAHFFGGEVSPSPRGWAVGVHRSQVVAKQSWMGLEDVIDFQLLSSHKDQVKKLPKGAQLYATNDFCPIAGFTLGSQIWTIQGHPEFTPAYSRALINLRREILGEETCRAGLDSLDTPTSEELLAEWMINFADK